MKALIKAIGLVLGVLMFIIGVLIMPLPGPFGAPVIFIGLVLILRSSSWVKRRFLRLVRRYPSLLYPIRKMLRPKAHIGPILYRQTLKLERFVLPKGKRPLRKIRRYFKGFSKPKPPSAPPPSQLGSRFVNV